MKQKLALQKPLLFSIALNGHQWLYKQLRKSHQLYADRMGYQYVQVTRPGFSALGNEVAWLKISLAIHALKIGYPWVIFLDADTEVADIAPDIRWQRKPGKSFFIANGFSGRPNSGVLIIQNTHESLNLLETILESALSPIDADCSVGWGENGHIIYHTRNHPSVQIIDSRWNNNHHCKLTDFIRHYSAGPMRKHYQPNMRNKILYLAYHYYLAFEKRLTRTSSLSGKQSFHKALSSLTNRVIIQYPNFFGYPAYCKQHTVHSEIVE